MVNASSFGGHRTVMEQTVASNISSPVFYIPAQMMYSLLLSCKSGVVWRTTPASPFTLRASFPLIVVLHGVLHVDEFVDAPSQGSGQYFGVVPQVISVNADSEVTEKLK